MPPKATPKKAAAPEPKATAKSTPAKATPKKDTTKEATKAPATPKKTKEAVKFNQLHRSGTVPIDVSFANDSTQAKLVKTGGYLHNLKLEAAASFSVVRTYTVTEGEDEGKQVIVLEPAKAFAFMKLNPELRARVYKFYFASKGVVDSPLIFGDGKRKPSGDVYAKSYAAGDKCRVALLAVNKMIYAESVQVFYNQTLRMESTGILMDYLAIIASPNKLFLRRLEIKSYQKATARNALAFLAEAKNLDYIKFDVGVAVDGDVSKAAKTFWTDAHKLLEALGGRLEKEMVADVKTAKVASAAPTADQDDDESSEAEDESAEEDDEEQSGSDNDEDESSGSENAQKKSPSSEATATDDGSDKQDVIMTEPTNVVDASVTAKKPETTTAVNDEELKVTAAEAVKTDATIAASAKLYADKAIAFQETASERPQGPKVTKVAQRQGRKSDAIGIINFGKDALKQKKGDTVANWTTAMVEQFRENLRAKLK